MLEYGIYVSVATRSIWIMQSEKLKDPYGILKDLKYVIMYGAPLELVAGICYVLDPGQAAYERKFMYYEWGWLCVVQTVYWYRMAFLPIQSVWKSLGREKSVEQSESHPRTYDFDAFKRDIEAINNDAFQQYLSDCLVIESLLFVRCVACYKQDYAAQTPVWRIQHAHILLEQFIRNGGPLELNISHRQRIDLIHLVNELTEEPKLYGNAPSPADVVGRKDLDAKLECVYLTRQWLPSNTKFFTQIGFRF